MKIKCLILLTCLSILIVTGCSKKEVNDISPITLTFYSEDLVEPSSFDDMVAKEITRQTGVTLELVPNYSGYGSELMLASETYTDIIYAKGKFPQFIEKEAIIPLDDYINKYGSNVKKLYGKQLVRLRNTLEDPHIYTLGTYEVNSKILEVSGNFQLQNAVLKEFGYPKISTLEDLENILLAYKSKYPVINGVPTAGLSLIADSWYWYLGLSNPAGFVIGQPDDGQWIVDQETLKATYKFLYPDIDIFYRWLNKLYNEGLLDPESFTQSNDLFLSKLKNGNVLSTSYPIWGMNDIHNYLVDNSMQERTFAYLPITAGPQYKDNSCKDYGFSGGWGIAISKDCKNPERAFKFLDWMCSEEAQILTNWGIEGKHYYYDSNGRRMSIVSNDENSGIGSWVYPFPEAGGGYIDSTGNSIARMTKENLIKNYCPAEKETLKAYGAEIWLDLFPSQSELGISKHGQVWQYPLNQQMTAIVSEVDDYVKEALIQMIVGPENEFEKKWEDLQNYLKSSQILTVQEHVTTLIQEKIKLWQMP